MSKKKIKSKRVTCKNCGESWMPYELPTNKEWTKLAPMPDSEGRVTIMIMATWTCPSCGKTKMGLKGKYKDEGTTGPSKKELIIEKINNLDGEVALTDLADEFGFEISNLEKALAVFIKQGLISGKMENGKFIK